MNQEARHNAGPPFLLFGHKAVTGLKCRYFSEVGNAACCAVDGVAQFAVFHQLEQRGERVLCLHDFAGACGLTCSM